MRNGFEKVYRNLELVAAKYPQFTLRISRQGFPRLAVTKKWKRNPYWFVGSRDPNGFVYEDCELAFTTTGIRKRTDYYGSPVLRTTDIDQMCHWIATTNWDRWAKE